MYFSYALKPCFDICMLFNAVFNFISVISRRPEHLPMLSYSSFNQYSAHYFFQATGCYPTQSLSIQLRVVREEWILSQWLLSILGDRTSEPLFSSPVSHRQDYRVGKKIQSGYSHNHESIAFSVLVNREYVYIVLPYIQNIQRVWKNW